ncbi:MAG TPA: amino acid ABC transporter permease [Pseudolabrys sp.]|nr:amino acid ABC transporter permease [Pseudolabrys sp.]
MQDSGTTRTLIINDPKVRGLVYQVATLIVIVGLGVYFVLNARANLENQRIATGFGFLENTAGFGVNQTLIPYQESDTYGRVFLVGLLNTLLVAGLGIVFATAIGFVMGIARLSSNWLIARLATVYVEVLRNQPLLFQILFWYLAVLGALPPPRQAISIGGEIFLSTRGVALPRPEFGPGSGVVVAAFVIGILVTLLLRAYAKRRQAVTGAQFPLGWSALALVVGLPLVVMVVMGFPIGIDHPRLRGFNFTGGMVMIPEFAALLIALSTYTGAFIAEIVRSGIQAVSRGQTEAAYSLGLRPGRALRLIIIPQALRVIIPPLTSQYLNLTKNSSLAVGIGYPDLFAVFAGTTLNQTGQAIEILAITMAVYLLISLITSALMNWYNARIALVER